MTTTRHTPIATRAAATAATLNAPLSQLDTAVVAVEGDVTQLYASVGSGAGWASTLDGTATLGQKVVPVASTTGAVAGMPVYLGLTAGTHEVGVIDTISAGVSVTLLANLTSTYAAGTPISATPAEVADARGTFSTLRSRADDADAVTHAARGGVLRHRHAIDDARDAIFLDATRFVLHSGSPALESAGSRFPSWKLPDLADSTIRASFVLPADWACYASDLLWTTVAAGGGNIRLTISVAGILTGEALGADATTYTATHAAQVGASKLQTTRLDEGREYSIRGGAYTNANGYRALALQAIRIARLPGDAADTLAADVQIIGVVLRRVLSGLHVQCDGDSLTVGTGSTAGNTYPERLSTLLVDTRTPKVIADSAVVNFGAGGETVVNMIANAAATIDATFLTNAPGVSDQIVMLWGGTNDLYFGATAAATFASIQTYCAARRAVGWKVIVGTILPRSNVGTPATFERDRQALNALIRAGWREFADGIMDVAADTRIGLAGQESNGTYYGDLVHLTNAGYAIVADYAHDAVLRVARLP